MITKTHQYLLSKLPDKLMKNILVVESGCWLWQTNINSCGYGRVSIPGTRSRVGAHKFIYILLRGEYDEKLQLDHLCKVRNCCNPTHCSPVTNKINMGRSSGRLFKKIKKPVADYFLSDLLEQYVYII